MNAELHKIRDGILNGDQEAVRQNVNLALDSGVGPKLILDMALISAMDEVGSLFEQGEFFVPEMLVSARAMKAGLEILKPILLEAKVKTAGKVLIGTVKGDLHDIGKNLVAMMLEGAGFEIHDLGVDVSTEKFIELIGSDDYQVLALSALLTTTMVNMGAAIQALEEAGVRERVKVVVGGAPVTKGFADSIGADGFAPDAGSAVAVVKSLLN
jgi:5-methyltetrahydrofolate--homocysteine methyltransferase